MEVSKDGRKGKVIFPTGATPLRQQSSLHRLHTMSLFEGAKASLLIVPSSPSLGRERGEEGEEKGPVFASSSSS